MIKISAVVVTYNRVHMLKKCLHLLLEQTYPVNSILVVNNHSTDNTSEYLHNLSNPKIKVINMPFNSNGAGGFHTGTEKICDLSNSHYFWLMDDDTMPTKDSLKYLVIAIKKLKGKFGFLCSNVRWWNNLHPCNMPTVSKNQWTQFASSYLIKVIESTFVSFLVPKSVVNKYGVPLARAVIWGDDTEYSSRISNKLSSYLVGNSIVLHMANNPDLSFTNVLYEHTNNRIHRYKYMYRNRLYVERKYRTFYSFMKWLISFTIVFLKVPFKSKDRRLMRMYYILNGIISGILFNPKKDYLIRHK